MQSNWYELKDKACKLRKKGISIRTIEQQLKIPRSTLSGWFKHIQLTKRQLRELDKRWRIGLIEARKLAVKWHNQQKDLRLKEAESWAEQLCSQIDFHDNLLLHLAF